MDKFLHFAADAPEVVAGEGGLLAKLLWCSGDIDMLRENSPTGTDIEDLTGGLFDLACLKIIIIITQSQSKIVEHPSINQNGRYILIWKLLH